MEFKSNSSKGENGKLTPLIKEIYFVSDLYDLNKTEKIMEKLDDNNYLFIIPNKKYQLNNELNNNEDYSLLVRKYLEKINYLKYKKNIQFTNIPAKDDLFEIGFAGLMNKYYNVPVKIISDFYHKEKIKYLSESINSKIDIINSKKSFDLVSLIKEKISLYFIKEDVKNFNITSPEELIAFSLAMPYYRDKNNIKREFLETLEKYFPKETIEYIVKKSDEYNGNLDKSLYYSFLKNYYSFDFKGIIKDYLRIYEINKRLKNYVESYKLKLDSFKKEINNKLQKRLSKFANLKNKLIKLKFY